MEQLTGRCECCDVEVPHSDALQLLCHECASIDLGTLRAVAAASVSAQTAQTERRVTAEIELRSEQLTQNPCAEDGTRLPCSVCLDNMRAGQTVGVCPSKYQSFLHFCCVLAVF